MPVARQPNENKVAHAMATHSRMVTQTWRHKIRIQDQFQDETTHTLIDDICRSLVRQIDAVIKDEQMRGDQEDVNERDYFIKYLGEARDGFDCLIGAADGETEDDRETEFNSQLNGLFDIGDWKIKLRGGGLQKFMWVG